jgi:hypothetical protein
MLTYVTPLPTHARNTPFPKRSSVTTVANCTLGYIMYPTFPHPFKNNQAHTTPRDRRLAILPALYAQCKYIVYSRTRHEYSIYKRPHI